MRRTHERPARRGRGRWPIAPALAAVLFAAAFAMTPSGAQAAYVEPRLEWARQVVDLVNAYRLSKGLPALFWDSRLAAAAQWMAEDMAQQCLEGVCRGGHVDRLGRLPYKRAQAFGFPWPLVGENAAFGFPTPADALEGWKTSPGHEANQTWPDYRTAGAGVACIVYDAYHPRCYYYIMFSPLGAPPQMASLWPCGEGTACISFRPPASGLERERLAGVRLISALDPSLGFARRETDIPTSSLLWGNTTAVGMPDLEGVPFYYGLALCYNYGQAYGCSDPVPAGAMAARRFPAGTREHWSFVMGGYRFLGDVTVWAMSDVAVPGKASDLALYDGLQGFGGTRRHACTGSPPGRPCISTWAAAGGYVSASQAFPPYGEVGTGVLLR